MSEFFDIVLLVILLANLYFSVRLARLMGVPFLPRRKRSVKSSFDTLDGHEGEPTPDSERTKF